MLPHWAPGAVAILSTGAGAPHAIPVSTGVRVDDRTVLIALARRRESLSRLRDERRALVSAVSRLTGEPHRTVHARINKATGAATVAKATGAQLEKGNRLLERDIARRG